MTQTQSKLLVMATALLAIILGLLAFNPFNLTSIRNSHHSTRVLTWWGYLDNKTKIQDIEKRCHTKLEIVEYLHTDDLKRYAEMEPYDLYIYPWGIHSRIEQYFRQQGPKINQVVEDYHRATREKYYQLNIPKDTLYFQHQLSMFVYDKNLIPDLSSINATDIIALAHSGKGKVMLMDQLEQVDWLIKQIQQGSPSDNWKKLYQRFNTGSTRHNPHHMRLSFSNFIADYIQETELVLGYLSSGELLNPNFTWKEAVDRSGQPKSFKFGVHPSLSHVSTDVLALKSHDKHDQCVAKMIGSRSFTRWIAQTAFYFSPFEEQIDSLPKSLQNLTQEFYDRAAQLPWSDGVTNSNPPSPGAEMIWNILINCQKQTESCGRWTAIGDKLFAGST